jgi:glycyl-tRNA synthetase
MSEVTMEKLVSLAKRRGFIYPGSEIYGGLAGTWDYGPLGVELKQNIKNLWWRKFVSNRDDMYGVDAAILMNPKVWEASGHVSGFTDPMVECKKCKKRFREDHVEGKKCPDCEGKLSEAKQFNMMFKTHIGSTDETNTEVYLRPETAQGMFSNFKNIVDSFSPKIPFGLAQIGKAFRNEISPRDFIFRVREFEQMEIEYFVKEEDWEVQFDYWQNQIWNWAREIGLKDESVSKREHDKEELSHYSKKTVDMEFKFPFGTSELYGLAYRTDFDLKSHSDGSGTELVYRTSEGEKFVPHVIEPTFGVERTILAVLVDAYNEDDDRVWLSFKPSVAPYKVAVFPLMRNKPELVGKAREVYDSIKSYIPNTLWDDNGNVGKRYRRQDEIGTPFCVTVDFEALEGEGVTVRNRDTMEQERVKLEELEEYLVEHLAPSA